MDLVLSPVRSTAADAPVEIVERKGRGHPDTICDALAERASVTLCGAYRERFGRILHHNVDKALLRAGTSRPAFGGGEVLAPIEIYLAGRAVQEAGGVVLPAGDLVVEACEGLLRETLHALDPARHVRVRSLLRPGSSELRALFADPGERWLANDTSIGVGFAPPTELERVVLAVAEGLEAQGRGAHPEVGEDVKVMGVRSGDRIHLTIACALVDRHVSSADDYLAMKSRVAELAHRAARPLTSRALEVTVNAADDVARGRLYLTVTGTSAEAGDDGQVGRGNRATGLITPHRPMSLEAVAGKNPVTHVGKIYNLVAPRIAAQLVEALPGVIAAECHLVSEIGRPVEDPRVADVRVATLDGQPPARFRDAAEAIVRQQLGALPALLDDVLLGRVRTF
jgi:S-adenosylmethionine synthetase